MSKDKALIAASIEADLRAVIKTMMRCPRVYAAHLETLELLTLERLDMVLALRGQTSYGETATIAWHSFLRDTGCMTGSLPRWATLEAEVISEDDRFLILIRELRVFTSRILDNIDDQGATP